MTEKKPDPATTRTEGLVVYSAQRAPTYKVVDYDKKKTS